MSCAAVEPCKIPDPTAEPQGHRCRGGCGDRLHGICGDAEQEGDSKLQRICPTCASKQSTKAASTAAAGKREAQAPSAATFFFVLFRNRSKPSGCWVEVKTLLPEMEATLTAAYGKAQASGAEPGSGGLAKTLDTLSSCVHQPQEERSPVTELEVNGLLANLDITPGKHDDKPAVQKAQVWATIEDQEDVAEAMRLDEAGDVAKTLPGDHVEEMKSSDGEKDDIDDGCLGGKGAKSSSYAKPSQHFGALEIYALGCGLTEARHLLKMLGWRG